MKATFDLSKVNPRFDTSTRNKELIHSLQLIDPVSECAVFDLRLYRGRSPAASRVYALLWWTDSRNGTYHSGSGFAKGGGYDLKSAAAADAMDASGIVLDQDIAGGGRTMMIEAARAVGKMISPGTKLILAEAYQ